MNVVHLYKYYTMKIYDIIKEESLEEGFKDKALAWGARKLGSLIGRGDLWHSAEELAPIVAKEIQRLGRKLTPEEIKQLIKTQHMTPEMEDALELAARKTKTGRLTSAERKAILDKFPDPDPKLVAKVEKKAADLADKAALDAAKRGIVGAGEGLSKGLWAGSKIVDGLLFLWKVKEFYEPYSEFKENMENADKWMQVPKSAGGWDEEKYKYVLNQQVSILVGRWGTLIVAGRLAKVVPFGLLAKAFGNSPTANILTKASKLEQNIFLSWCNNPDNAEAVAAIMAQPLVAGNNALGLGIGSTVAAAWEKLPGLNLLLTKPSGSGNAPAGDTPAGGGPAGNPDKPTAQQGGKPTEKEPEDSADADDLTHLDWKDLGNNRIQDPKTGEIWKDIGSGRIQSEKTGMLSYR